MYMCIHTAYTYILTMYVATYVIYIPCVVTGGTSFGSPMYA